jgi:hypothetical protein
MVVILDLMPSGDGKSKIIIAIPEVQDHQQARAV